VRGGAGFGSGVVFMPVAATMPPAQVRANLTMVLVDIGLVGLLAATGRRAALAVATVLSPPVPFGLANRAGSRLFDPGRVRACRRATFALIVGAALAGLPVWTG
jgi:hypothetical protein